MLGDLKSKRLIVAKGTLFGFCLLSSATTLWFRNPSLVTALLLAALVWSSARLYYFLFYVLQTYVDPALKYDGLWAMFRQLSRRR